VRCMGGSGWGCVGIMRGRREEGKEEGGSMKWE
jgi:hypothetical protein